MPVVNLFESSDGDDNTPKTKELTGTDRVDCDVLQYKDKFTRALEKFGVPSEKLGNKDCTNWGGVDCEEIELN